MDIKKMFVENQGLLEGHFLLSSGLHSGFYMQSAKVLQDPKKANILGKKIADEIKAKNIDISLVVSPALGGVIIGHEVARELGVNFVFTERNEGKMQLRRGFTIEKNTKVAVVEDVFTTGKSTREVIALINEIGANVVLCASIVDRSGGKLDFGVETVSLLNLNLQNYAVENCPFCKKGLPVQKPGTRDFSSLNK